MHRKTAEHPAPTPVPDAAEADRVPDMPFAEGALDSLDPDLRHRLVSEAAYELYVKRGYGDGYDLDDWLQAETTVDHVLLNPEG